MTLRGHVTLWGLVVLTAAVACGDDDTDAHTPGRDAAGSPSSGRDAASEGDAALARHDAGDSGLTLPPGSACSNDACTKANGGAAAICMQGKRCVPLLSNECRQVDGPFRDDDAFVIARIGGFREPALLAVDEINELGGGLPGSGDGPRRPLVLLGCDYADPVARDAIMDHLIDDLSLPAAIAPVASAEVLALKDRSVPAGMFLIAPAAGAPVLSHLDDDGLVWSVIPSHGVTVPALARVIEQSAAKLVAQGVSEPLRVALFAGDGITQKDALDQLLSQLQLNGHGALDPENQGQVFKMVYGVSNPIGQNTFAEIAAQALDFEPHIVVGIGSGESIAIALNLEDQWTETDYRPEYVFNAYSRDPVWLPDVANKDGLAERIRGSYIPNDRPGYQGFVARYTREYGEPLYTAHQWYDAVYTIAYATTAAASEGEITGVTIARGIAKLVPPGPAIDVGLGSDSGNIQRAMSLLTAGDHFDLQGTSGDLDFDLTTGVPSPESTPVQTWCVGYKGAALQYLDAGQLYDPATDTLQGEFACPSDPAP